MPPEVLDLIANDGAFLEALNEGVVIEDHHGVVVACNSKAERLLGLSFAELASGTWVERWRAVREERPFIRRQRSNAGDDRAH
jgi:PAS domain-containing protein